MASQYINKGAGTYDIDISHGYTGTTGSIAFTYGAFENHKLNFKNRLPKQILRLREVRVLMQTDEDSLRARILNIKLPYLSANHQIDSNEDTLFFQVALGDKALTHSWGKDQPLFMDNFAPENYTISVYNADNQIETRINSLLLVFENEYGSF